MRQFCDKGQWIRLISNLVLCKLGSQAVADKQRDAIASVARFLNKQSGGRPQQTVHPRRLLVNTVIL